ncbi:Glycosyl transferase group 1 [Candidatus Methylomirabilis lanthanidiphila]|uniref:Glycosyl transferase group 1 n=1 Tax=Candidatus Methylomirabilis lanthanidiphila TaxID=2211376 RepID=A0A564ZHY3_9BACT|nr:Glycosyl transferase group 1 [Candidatus Methylomirabilis lanthanidiphila]
MISPQFRPIVGGYERAAERLSAGLAALGHAVTVITERRDRAWPAQEERDGFRVRRLWCLYRPRLHMLTSMTAFAWFLVTQGRRFQIWHLHQYGLHAVLAVGLGKFLHRPVVLKLASTKDQGLERTASALPLARIAQALLRRVDAAVALTYEMKEEALRFGIPASRIHVVGNGVDTLAFRPHGEEERTHFKRQLGIDAKGMVVSVGRLSEEKNPDGLLRAWQIALSDLPTNWKLVLVGDGPMRAELEAFVNDHGLVASVILAGQQSRVEDWMKAADIFVLASHWEGLSNTMLEAMASGLPVISTRVSGCVDLLEKTGAGAVVETGDIATFAEMIVRLAKDPTLRYQMGYAGRPAVEREYSIKVIAAHHKQLYHNLLDGIGD